MRYFQNSGKTYGYDELDPSQADLIVAAVASNWTEVTGNWPPVSTNAQKLATAISALNSTYQTDAQTLQMSWLAALVSDGSTQTTKQDAVTALIATRKAQYISDLAAAKAQYPVT